jgi:hypothetical protein
VTAFIPWLLDYRSKQDLYNSLQFFFWRLANPIKKPIRAESGNTDSLELPSTSRQKEDLLTLGERFTGR